MTLKMRNDTEGKEIMKEEMKKSRMRICENVKKEKYQYEKDA